MRTREVAAFAQGESSEGAGGKRGPDGSGGAAQAETRRGGNRWYFLRVLGVSHAAEAAVAAQAAVEASAQRQGASAAERLLPEAKDQQQAARAAECLLAEVGARLTITSIPA